MSKEVLRRAKLDEKVRNQIQQRVQKLLKQKKQNGDEKSDKPDSAQEPDVNEEKEGSDSEGEDDGEGAVFLFDADDHSRAINAHDMVAIKFKTRNEYKQYLKGLKKHRLEPGTKVIIEEEGGGKGKKQEGPKDKRGPAKDEEPKDKKPKKEEPKEEKPKKDEPKEEKPVKKDEEGKPDKKDEDLPKYKKEEPKEPLGHNHPSRLPDGNQRQIAIKDSLIEQFGGEAKDWKVHKIHPSQMSPMVTVNFPDGSSKKYGQLSADEKTRVDKALGEGLAASKGLSDYTSVTPAALQHNMKVSLARYDNPDIEEEKNEDQEPVSKENINKFSAAMRENGRTLLKKYKGLTTSESRPMAESFVDDFSSVVAEAVRDGSLQGVKQADLDEFMRESVKRLMHQEVETRRRSLGDHGIRHVVSNCKSSLSMLEELKKSGMQISGKQKLMAIATMVDHDIGYTVGEAGTDTAKGGSHKKNSKAVVDQEPERMDKIFGKEEGENIRHLIETHDDPELDWDKDPVTSAVRLADNTSLFGKEKVQDLFLRSPKATALACKLRLAAEAKPDDKKLQQEIKNQMHEVVDGDEFEDADRELLHKQIDEMNEDKYSTTVDILSRYSGELTGFKFDGEKRLMNVNMRYSSEGQMVDQLFGDAVACRQFDKLAKDLGGAPVRGKRGNTQFKNAAGKPVFQLNIDGFDEKDEPQTAAMRDFAQKTARTELRQASMLMYPPPDASEKEIDKAKKAIEPAKDKFSEEEWEKLMEAFDEGKGDPIKLAKQLGMWPLLQSEFAFLESKTAADRMVRRIMISTLTDRVATKVLKELDGDQVLDESVKWVAGRGHQTQRKDKDLMSDTGGISKNRHRDPEVKPPRTDSHNRYRTKDKTPDQRDPDVDRPIKARTACMGPIHPLDQKESGVLGMMLPVENYHRQVWGKLCNIVAEAQHVSEKSFAEMEHIQMVADQLVRSPKGEEMIQTFIGVGARPEMCAEGMYHEMIAKGNTASSNFETMAKSALASSPKTLREAVQRG